MVLRGVREEDRGGRVVNVDYELLTPFGGLGAGALGFIEASAKVQGHAARFVLLGGIDFDPGACRNFKTLTGAPEICVDIAKMTRAELRAFVVLRSEDLDPERGRAGHGQGLPRRGRLRRAGARVRGAGEADTMRTKVKTLGGALRVLLGTGQEPVDVLRFLIESAAQGWDAGDAAARAAARHLREMLDAFDKAREAAAKKRPAKKRPAKKKRA